MLWPGCQAAIYYTHPALRLFNRFAHSAGPGMEQHVGIDARGCTPPMASEVPLAGKSALRKRLRVTGFAYHIVPGDGQLSKKSRNNNNSTRDLTRRSAAGLAN